MAGDNAAHSSGRVERVSEEREKRAGYESGYKEWAGRDGRGDRGEGEGGERIAPLLCHNFRHDFLALFGKSDVIEVITRGSIFLVDII